MLYHTAPLNDAAVPHLEVQHYFRDQVKCIYKAERELLSFIEEVLSSARTSELKKAIGNYLLQVQAQILRLEEIFGILLINPGMGPCESITGLMRETKRMIRDTVRDSIAKDTAIAFAIRKAIYYKIAAYSAMEMLAESQGMEEPCNLIHISLEEEKDSEMVLSDIAERRIKNL
jgi:ferritin-like metal-binding protein YciE